MKTSLVHARSGARVDRARVSGKRSATAIFDERTGEINAIDRKDLIQRLADFVDLVQQGEVVSASADDDLGTEDVENMVRAALEDKEHGQGGGMWVMGDTLNDAVHETSGRIGFTERILFRCEKPINGEGRIRVKQKGVVSWILTGGAGAAIPRSIIRNHWLYPKAITIPTFTTIEDTEKAVSPPELLDEKYTEMLQATMVRQDKYIRWLLTSASNVYNNVYTFSALTPATFTDMQLQIQRWGLSTPHCIMAIDLWKDIRTNANWLAVYEPVTQLTLLEEGRLGRVYETAIYTDGLRYETLQVLEAGELFMLAEPEGLGGYIEYSPLETRPADMHHVGVGAEGWYSKLTRAYALGNSRGVCYGYRAS